jgi:DNA-binding NarL/FixJ family response regulator
MRILIADDHAILREGLKQLLALQIPGAIFGEAAGYEATLALIDKETWDVLVLDIFMPGRSGFDVLKEVEVSKPELPVLVLSSAPEAQMALRVLRAGAAGYLNKQVASAELARAVKKVAAGGTYVSESLSQKLAGELAHPSRPPQELLSDREFQVLQMLLAGKSVKDIANALGLSPKTVSTFRTRLKAKLGLQSDVELVRYGMDNNLVESPVLPPEPPPQSRRD